jgi:glycine hydroxymethyltransferase
MAVNELFERLLGTIEKHEEWRLKECLNLIPSENRSSPLMRSMFMTDVGNRYTAPDQFYRGTKFLDELQAVTEEIARKVYRAKFADVRPLSGHTADMAVLLALTRQGDEIVSVHPDNGGYPGITHLGLGNLLRLKNRYFPYDLDAVNIDVNRSRPMLEGSDAKVVFFGASFIPFPHPTKELSPVARGVRVFDGSHVLGLIAGGAFQDPLREGCSLLIGSTHKSLPGPQGGIILSNNEEVFSRVSSKIHPGIVDNIHLNRVAALAVALLEMMQFGKSYAAAVVKNSQELARALAQEGVPVRGSKHGYTKSHQVLLDYGAEEAKTVSHRLEKANIISDDGGRLGTSELTRMGYGPGEMRQIAALIGEVVRGTSPGTVRPRVRALVKRFQEPKYVLKSVPRLP